MFFWKLNSLAQKIKPGCPSSSSTPTHTSAGFAGSKQHEPDFDHLERESENSNHSFSNNVWATTFKQQFQQRRRRQRHRQRGRNSNSNNNNDNNNKNNNNNLNHNHNFHDHGSDHNQNQNRNNNHNNNTDEKVIVEKRSAKLLAARDFTHAIKCVTNGVHGQIVLLYNTINNIYIYNYI